MDYRRIDLVTGFLQEQEFNKVIYIISPRDSSLPGTAWKLKHAAYGFTDSERVWYLIWADKLVKWYGLSHWECFYTLYDACNAALQLELVFAVQVDDYMYTDKKAKMKWFEAFLDYTFDIRKCARGTLELIGGKIMQPQYRSRKLLQNHMLQGYPMKYFTMWVK